MTNSFRDQLTTEEREMKELLNALEPQELELMKHLAGLMLAFQRLENPAIQQIVRATVVKLFAPDASAS